MIYKLNVKKPPLLCLILLISFPSVSTVLISPALPTISDFFHISNGYAQQLITLFVLGYALGQLLYSPIANRFGRKPAIYLGIIIYLISCLVCLLGIYLQNMPLILLGRFFMAIGASVGMVISFTIINDFYLPEQARSVTSYTVLAYSFMPALAIALGGVMTTHLSWVDCFYFYLLYGILILIASSRLPETLHTKDFHAMRIKPVFRALQLGFTNSRLVLFASIYGLMSCFVYLVTSGAPFIGMDKIGLTSAAYGFLLLIPYSGQFLGAIFSGRATKWLSMYQVMFISYSTVAFGTLFMLVSFVSGYINTFTLMAPIFFVMIGLPMSYSGATVMALAEHQDKATGSAVMSFITMLIALMATFILSLLPSKNPLVMPILFLITLIFASIVFWVATRRFKQS